MNMPIISQISNWADLKEATGPLGACQAGLAGQHMYLCPEAENKDVVGVADVIHLSQLLLQLSLHHKRTQQVRSDTQQTHSLQKAGGEL